MVVTARGNEDAHAHGYEDIHVHVQAYGESCR
jgi:hypothetical protein